MRDDSLLRVLEDQEVFVYPSALRGEQAIVRPPVLHSGEAFTECFLQRKVFASGISAYAVSLDSHSIS